MSVTAVNRQRRKRATGIEPAWPAWKAGTLPLSYARKADKAAVRRGICQAVFDSAGAMETSSRHHASALDAFHNIASLKLIWGSRRRAFQIATRFWDIRTFLFIFDISV
jgi:hypothetical protein